MRKNIVRAAAALLLLMALLPASALADRFAVVKGGRLNLRQYPSTSSYSLGKYDTGSWVLAGSESGGWCQVKTMDGKRGYMSAGYLDFGQYGGGATVRYANGGYVNLRSGPSTDAGIIMRVTSGSTFYMQGSYGGWRYGYVYSGGTPVYGYMSEAFLDTGTTTSVVTTRNGGKVNVRSGPGSSYASVGKLASGTQVTVLLKGNGWYMISANGLEGFMSTQYLSGTGSTIGSNTGTTSLTAWVNNPISTQVLNLRETPSQSARSIGQYRNGTQVKVVKKGSTWCEVYVGTRHGYMMTRYLSFDGNYLAPSYPTTPSYPSEPIYPTTPSYPSEPSYPSYPSEPSYPTVTAVPPQSSSSEPKAGDTVTLTTSAGSMITVYHDSSLTQIKGSYAYGTQAMMLQYGTSTCMIYVDGGVAYVPTWNVIY
ncbi:MAG: SH3 domain-containing protein [Candidatus Ventricola sp.]